MPLIRHPKDFWSGALFTSLGVFAIVAGAKYNLGTAARMGPGYFPRILGILMVVLGLLLAVRSLRVEGTAIPRWHWKPTALVLGSVVVFGYVMQYIGIALGTVVLILIASAASHEFRVRDALISGVLLAALAVGVFVVGLNVQLPIWPGQH